MCMHEKARRRALLAPACPPPPHTSPPRARRLERAERTRGGGQAPFKHTPQNQCSGPACGGVHARGGGVWGRGCRAACRGFRGAGSQRGHVRTRGVGRVRRLRPQNGGEAAPRITRCTRRSRCRTGVARSAGSTRAAWRLAPPSPRQCSPQARPTRLARRRTRAGVCRGRVASRPTPACAAARRPAPPAARACDATVSRLRGGVALLAFRGTQRCLSDSSISV